MARKKGQRRVTQSSAKGGGFSTGWMVLLVVGLVLVGAAAFLLGRGSGQPETTATRPTSAASGPRLGLDKTSLDFGDIQFEKPAHAEFVLRNDGNQTLQILGQPQVELVQGC
jgi:hypothetical protein